MITVFNLLCLPSIPLHTVLDFMNPNQFIALSLCSKSSYSICKTYRNTERMKKQIKSFTASFSLKKDITLKFNTASDVHYLKFIMNCFRNEVDRKQSERCFKLGGLYFHTFLQRVLRIPYNKLWADEPDYIIEHGMLIHYDDKEVVQSFKTMTSYLSNLYNIQLTSLSLNYRYLPKDLVQQIMESYCASTLTDFELNDDKIKDYSIVNYDEQTIISILKKQNSTQKLNMMFNPSPDFAFDFNYLRNSPEYIEIEHSHWITWNQLLSFESENVYLCRSNFFNSDFKNLVKKWRDGWTPKWKRLMIQFKNDLNVDSLIFDRFMEIDLKDCRASFILKNNSIRAYKFKAEFYTSKGPLTKIGYHLTRPDQSIATVTVENKKIGWFHMQSNKQDEDMMISVTKHAFY